MPEYSFTKQKPKTSDELLVEFQAIIPILNKEKKRGS